MVWNIEKAQNVLTTVPFAVEQLDLSPIKSSKKAVFHRLNCRDWVTILPLTTSFESILIRQFRVGPFAEVLETPGGAVDPNETTEAAAARELEEETGFRPTKIVPMLSISPNPAIQTNLIHYYIAYDCYIPKKRNFFPDEHEDISLELFKADELAALVTSGRINHSLSALCIQLALHHIGKKV